MGALEPTRGAGVQRGRAADAAHGCDVCAFFLLMAFEVAMAIAAQARVSPVNILLVGASLVVPYSALSLGAERTWCRVCALS